MRVLAASASLILLLAVGNAPRSESQPVSFSRETVASGLEWPGRFAVSPAGGPPRGASEAVLDGIPAGTFHNGGILGFAPDKTLFITTGDTTTGGNSQDPLSLAGKGPRGAPGGSRPPAHPPPASPGVTPRP